MKLTSANLIYHSLNDAKVAGPMTIGFVGWYMITKGIVGFIPVTILVIVAGYITGVAASIAAEAYSNKAL
jgi:hypothetical protein